MSTLSHVRFGDLLERVERRIALDDSEHYQCVGVRWYGMGAFVRRVLPGASISRKQQWIIRSGDVVYNKLFAWKGAFAIVDGAVDGCIVSDKFPTYRANAELLDERWLACYFRTPTIARQAEALSKGAAAISKLTLNPPQFWELSIPLPTLVEQRRIVARIEELAAKIGEAKALRKQVAEETEALRASSLNAVFGALPVKCPRLLAEVAEIIGGGSLPEVASPGEVSSGILLVKVSDMNRPGNEVFVRDSAMSLPEGSPLLRGRRVLPANSVIFPKRGGAIATNKKRMLRRPAVLDPNMMGVFSTDEEQLAPEFLFKWFANLDLASMQDGTSVPQINKGDLAPLQIPVPAISEQRRIVAELDALQAEMDKLKRLQAETSAELDALLPSVLDRAFKGEL